LEVLQLELRQHRPWHYVQRQTVYILADARGTPPNLAAFLFCEEGSYYTECEPDDVLLSQFHERADAQIMGLEMLAIALALCSFADKIAGKHIMLFSDNVGSEVAARSGKAKQFDHACLAHSIWTKLLEIDASIYVDRVATDLNIADLPSRRDFYLLKAMRCVQLEPRLDSRFRTPKAWGSLSISHCLHARR
jgi:hypothetical protein